MEEENKCYFSTHEEALVYTTAAIDKFLIKSRKNIFDEWCDYGKNMSTKKLREVLDYVQENHR